ncbi:MAG: phosphotransferase family protein [Actinomycetes bacterium]
MTVRTLPGLDLDRLRAHLDAVTPQHAGLAWLSGGGRLEAEVVVGGRSNLTYVVTGGEREWVLRRPPLGHVLATAHDMSREYRVMTALAGTPVPVPRTYLLCEDQDVLGAPFYLMERVHGSVYRDVEHTATLGPQRASALAYRLVDTLADLHAVDPVSVGLADFGRPEGFLERQVRRWRTQLEASRSRDVPGIDDLAERLAANIPATVRTSIVHGDYRLDNVIVDTDESGTDRIAAVVDWEMATLGDPLTDLGLLVVYWERMPAVEDSPVAKGVGPEYGFPSAGALLDRYAARSGTDLADLSWYVAFASLKLAVILEGIHLRYTQGKTVGEGFDRVATLVAPLVANGLATLEEDG